MWSGNKKISAKTRRRRRRRRYRSFRFQPEFLMNASTQSALLSWNRLLRRTSTRRVGVGVGVGVGNGRTERDSTLFSIPRSHNLSVKYAKANGVSHYLIIEIDRKLHFKKKVLLRRLQTLQTTKWGHFGSFNKQAKICEVEKAKKMADGRTRLINRCTEWAFHKRKGQWILVADPLLQVSGSSYLIYN